MADYKKKKGIRVSVGRNTKNAGSVKVKNKSDFVNSELQSDSNMIWQESNSSKNYKELKNTPEKISDEVQKELLNEAEKIPAKERKTYRSEREIRKSKPPAKRYAARRPVTYDSGEEERRFSVVDGKKLLRRRQKMITLALVGVLVLLLIFASFSTPVGITEYLQNNFSKIGSGNGYPILISDDNVLFADSAYGVTTVVGEAMVECYNQNGKQVFIRPHGFNNPALAQSQSRMIVYDRGGTGYSVENYNKILFTGDLKQKIYTAAMGRNGTMAFATDSVEYNSELSVYDKNMQNIFNWYSANATLTATGISNNGKQIAAATSSAAGGTYESTVYIFDVNSSDPTATVTISGSMVVSIQQISDKNFLVLCNDQAIILDWSGNQQYVYKTSGTLSLVKEKDGQMLFIDKLSTNSGEYHVSVIDRKFASLVDFQVNMTLKDAVLSGNYLYFLTDNRIMTYDFSGTFLFGMDCDFSVSGITTFGDGNVLEVGLGEINFIKAEQMQNPAS